MAAKMEVLSRRAGAPRAPMLRLDPSLSLSFQLPTTMRLREPNPTILPLPTPPLIEPTPTTEDTDDSWETKDWSVPATTTRRVVDASMGVHAVDIDETDPWEEADAPELPDDFPVLIVNLSRLRDLHFRTEETAIAMDTDDDLRAFYTTVKHTLYAHFTEMTEVLFEQEVCFHTHYGTYRQTLENLHRAFPSDVLAVMDYPVQLAGLDLHEYLHVLTAPTQWPSVNYLKECLRQCSRDLEWKFEIALELEKLAQQEYEWWTSEQQRRNEEIDTLTQLRDSFREKLRTTDDKHKHQYLLLRKLEDLETRLVQLIDVFLQEPELTARESRELMGFLDATPSMQMRNVLDMVVAMIFSRLPRDYGAQPTKEAHFEMLLDHHLHIRRLWKRDFGRLPARTGGNDDDVEADEEMIGDEPVTGLENSFDQLMVNDVDDDERDKRNDDWEAIADDHDVIDDDIRENHDNGVVERTEKPTIDGLDGYGADYESDGSDHEDDSNGVAQESTNPPTALVKRRPRRTKKLPTSSRARDRSPSPAPPSRPSPSERELALEAFMYGHGESSSGDEANHRQPFQGFARTGALQVLRRAKENEGFGNIWQS